MSINNGGLDTNRVMPAKIRFKRHDEALRELIFCHATRDKQVNEYIQKNELDRSVLCAVRRDNLAETIRFLQDEQAKEKD